MRQKNHLYTWFAKPMPSFEIVFGIPLGPLPSLNVIILIPNSGAIVNNPRKKYFTYSAILSFLTNHFASRKYKESS